MRQQLRLRVLLPVAVLALLGAGVAAYASGGGGGGSDESEFVVTHRAKPKPVSTLGPTAWAKQADAVCREAIAQARALEPRTVVGLEAALAKAVPLAEQTDERLAALGLPQGNEALAKGFLRTSRAETAAGGKMLTALQHGDGKAFRAAGRTLDRLERRFDRFAHQLGAHVCAQATATSRPEPTAEENGKALLRRPAKALNLMLLNRPAVVVVFYRPDGGVDGASVFEARAASLAVHAGFLPVNVRRNAAVSELASKYEVLSSPAVLVFVRGPKLVAHFDGFVDRKTVEQAVTNALS
jgi:hypothetical protein